MDEIAKLIEQRRAEAVRKNLSVKLLEIARTLGEPVRSHDGTSQGRTSVIADFPWYDNNPLEDPMWQSFDNLPAFDDGDDASTIGFFYDGMRHGHHLEVRHLAELGELKATWQGRIVFLETGGQIESYVPGEKSWEAVIETLHAAATARIARDKPVEDDKKQQEHLKKARGIFAKLRELWGV
jgi:hypothetical protein